MSDPAVQMDLSLQVGKYDVQKAIGKGATGTVYLAKDTFTGGEVALKTIEPEVFRDPEFGTVYRSQFQNEASLPFGVMFNTLTCASVFSSYEMIHPVYGWMSQCDDQLVYTTPLSRSSAGRSLYILPSKITDVPLLFAPVPGKVA